MDLTTFALLFFAVIVGFAIGFLFARSRQVRLEERNAGLQEQQTSLTHELESERERAREAEKKLATLEADHRNLGERLARQKEELETVQQEFQDRFENLANKILEEKSKKFTEQNREKLDQLLTPLGEKIEEFKRRVEEGHKEDIKGRSALEQHLKMLQSLNQNMAEEAKSLTRALKGDTKRQGNWGEVILQRILERSGLQKDREYEVQQSFVTEDGRRLQPDAVVRLPDDKHLVVDSKVSLKAYEAYVSADEDSDQSRFLKDHIQSVRTHVRQLSDKNYQQLHQEKSPDFVLLFVPIEPAFGLAMQHDSELYNEAFERNIIIVSPTTLLATLATIDNVWKQEYQSKHAMEIAQRGGALYDKFVGFVESMESIGQRIEQSMKSYDEAMNRLKTGSGNLVRQVEMLKKLGAKTSKKLPDGLVEQSDNHEENEPESQTS